MSNSRHKTDWFWVFYGLLFYLVFHLGTLIVVAILSRSAGGFTWVTYVLFTVGFLLVGTFIGYHSRGVTIREPALAAGLYVVLLFLFSLVRRGTEILTRTFFLEFGTLLGIGLLCGFAGGYLGEKMQEWKEKGTG
jgi:hypothetical protein